jgi:hypothetical protein
MSTSSAPRPATASATRLIVPQLLGLRLASQGLVPIAPGSPADPAAALEPESRAAAVADRLLALQGQDLPGALWSFGVRDRTLTREDVAAAFARGELVRSWLFRGTLFITSARDLRWLLALSAGRVLGSSVRRRTQLGLDPETLARARAAAEGALAEHPEGLVRARMLEAFERAGVSTAGGRGYHLLFWLSVTGVLVQGPLDGAEQRFLLLDEWVPTTPEPTGDEALAELVARYVRGRGPVTEDDLAWWTKLPRADLRRGRAAAGDRVVAVAHAGREYLVSPEMLAAVPRAAGVHALPGFDEYLLGYGDRSPQLAPAHAARIVPGGNGVFRATIVHGGRVVGVWTRRRTGDGLTVAAEPFDAELPATAARGFEQTAARYRAFLGAE